MNKNIGIIIQKMYETGVAKVVSNLSQDLSNKKYNKTIFTYDASKIGFEYDGNIVDLKTNSDNIFKKLLDNIKRYYLIKKSKKELSLDVSISFQLNASLINILTKRNEKVIISIRSYLLKDATSKIDKYIYRNIVRFLFNKADLIVPVSESIKYDLIKNYNVSEDKIKVIYNYYDIDNIVKLSKEFLDKYSELYYKKPIIITSGRISRQKGQWHLIRAFRGVKDLYPDAQLLILGDGVLKGYLEELIVGLELYDNVHFLGFQKNPYKYIARADLYVFPSLYEGFPNALAEAMACGVPVISSDCPSGPREILSPNLDINEPMIDEIVYDDYGILVPTPDGTKYSVNDPLTKEEEMLAEAIITMLNNEELLNKYKEKSLERISDFHKDKIIGQWEEEL